MTSSAPDRTLAGRCTALSLALLFVLFFVPAVAHGEGQSAQPPPAASLTPRELAPVDLTGYSVSVVTEDWRYRMVMPPKGDSGSVPLNAAGRRAVDAWTSDQAGRCEENRLLRRRLGSRRLRLTDDDRRRLAVRAYRVGRGLAGDRHDRDARYAAAVASAADRAEMVEQIRRIKAAVSIPVIGSLNGIGTGDWLRYAH
jgi:hypothetical protein